MPFRSVIGHRRVVSLLARAVARRRVPPALLLAGPAGVGKRRVAQALAEALNCLQPSTEGSTEGSDPGYGSTQGWADACGACAACRRIARGVHPDVIVVEPGDSGTIKIEQIRDVIDRSGYRPFEGRLRVVIIDAADALVPPAQNALLKTLEEPPPASIFVLIASTPDSLLPTVLSRCPRLRFGPLTAAEIAEALMRDHGYAEPDARAVAADADGSLLRALAAASADVTVAREVARRVLADTARTTDPTRRLEVAKLLSGAKGGGNERDQLAVLLRVLSSLLRDLGLTATAADPRMLANADLQGDLARLAGSWDGDRASRAFAAVDQALGALDRNASPKVVADWLVLQL